MATSDVSSTHGKMEPSLWLWAAMFVSLGALAGSLYLSLGMNLKACPLCFYQRTFVMGVVGVLAVGFFLNDLEPRTLSLLVLPLSVGAAAIAGFHCYLEYTGFLECPKGIFGVGSAPQQSLVILLLLVALVLLDVVGRRSALGIGAAMVLGGLFAFSGIKTTPPSPPPSQAYLLPVDEDGCRRPFTGPASQ
jgi:hypothetical protein